MMMMTAPIRESCHSDEFSSPFSSSRILSQEQHRRYSLSFLFLLSILSTSTSAYRTATLPSSITAAKSWNRSGRRTLSMLLHLSTPTNPSNNNNNIIEDDEDAKIFAALSSSSSPAPLLEEEEMMVTNTDAAYTGSVDWDAEWKAVMKKEQKGPSLNKKNRPGSDYYKSEAEIAAIVRIHMCITKASSPDRMTETCCVKHLTVCFFFSMSQYHT